jgi:nucleoside-diphosphate-sugar epimerase
MIATVVVTGAAGFLGSHVVELLSGAGRCDASAQPLEFRRHEHVQTTPPEELVDASLRAGRPRGVYSRRRRGPRAH